MCQFHGVSLLFIVNISNMHIQHILNTVHFRIDYNFCCVSFNRLVRLGFLNKERNDDIVDHVDMMYV
jgi:hypothetical protein